MTTLYNIITSLKNFRQLIEIKPNLILQLMDWHDFTNKMSTKIQLDIIID